MSGSPRSVPSWLLQLIADAKAVDGAPPFSDQSLVDYRLGSRELVTVSQDAAALATEVDTEFVVAPDARRHGIGTQLLETLLMRSNGMRFWAHGDHPGARALAKKYGFTATRELLHLVGPVPPGAPRIPSAISSFRVARDEDEWVALNAKTFAHHPEQGSVSRSDLEQLETESWFDAHNFLVLRRDDRMIGYCWLKVEGDRGEFYVVGVSPDHQGEHLGSVLFDAGLARLAQLGIRHAHLYVEGDNEPALRLYHSRGFTQDSIDIQYSTG
jgi:mycothiol synthase